MRHVRGRDKHQQFTAALERGNVIGLTLNQQDITGPEFPLRQARRAKTEDTARMVQCQNLQAVPLPQMRLTQSLSVQARTTHDRDLGQLEIFGAALQIGVFRHQTCAQQRLVIAKLVHGVGHQQLVTRLHRHIRQGRDIQVVTPKNAMNLEFIIGLVKHLRQSLTNQGVTLSEDELGVEYPGAHISHRGLPVRYEAGRDQPEV